MTSYRLAGKGRLVLLLHGWGDSQQSLEALFDDLSGSCQVLSLDLPGFGATQAPKQVWNLDDYARFVAKVLEKLKLGKPYAIIGHSNGGALAIRGLSQGILGADKLVLIAASGIRTGNQLKRLVLMIVAKTGNLATIWMPERYRRALRKSLYGSVGSDMLVAPHLTETFKKTVRQDVQADASALKLPVLLIYGSADEAVPLSDGRKYGRLIQDAHLEVIDGAGHFLHQQQAQKVNRLVGEFLK
jgi:pimeloyl-ACP methyl ester carboxylesterase